MKAVISFSASDFSIYETMVPWTIYDTVLDISFHTVTFDTLPNTMHKSHRQPWMLMAWAWWYYSEWRLHDLSLKPIKSSVNMLATEDRQEWARSNIWAYNFMGVYLYWMNECFPHWILSPYSWPINKQHLMMYRLYHWWFTFSTNNIGKENNWIEDCGTLFVLTPAIS